MKIIKKARGKKGRNTIKIFMLSYEEKEPVGIVRWHGWGKYDNKRNHLPRKREKTMIKTGYFIIFVILNKLKLYGCVPTTAAGLSYCDFVHTFNKYKKMGYNMVDSGEYVISWNKDKQRILNGNS